MLKWFRQLDSILRGQATRLSLLQDGQFRSPAGGLSLVILVLGVAYGLCMGSFAMIRTGGAAYPQFIASAIKLPALFFLTLAITFPSLYVFNALIGSRLSLLSALRVLFAALGVMLATLASLGPIVVFFGISTTSYPFMVVLNVAMATVAGMLGLTFLLRTLHRLLSVEIAEDSAAAKAPQALPVEPLPEGVPSALPPPLPKVEVLGALDAVGGNTRKARSLFRAWVLVFALVGAQMSWVLRPFIGDPNAPFEIFRHRQGNFFLAVISSLTGLIK